MATTLVTGIVTMLFNWTMLKYVGENGVAAITIIMYVLMFATSIYTGYSYGISPMISYNYGAENKDNLKNWLKKSNYYSCNSSFCYNFILSYDRKSCFGIYTS